MANSKARVTQRDIYRSYSSRLRDDPRVISDAMNLLDMAGWVSARYKVSPYRATA